MLLRALLIAGVLLVGCGDDGDGDAASSSGCAPSEDTAGDVITGFDLSLDERRAEARYMLNRDADAGIIVQRASDLRLVGRVPFGGRLAQVALTDGFDLPTVDNEPLAAGEYLFTLRAFEPGTINDGSPIDTASVCLEVPSL